jgi:GT2 family glycosyltransferase
MRIADQSYQRWVEFQEAAFPSPEWYREEASRWAWNPRISIVMATQDPNSEWLKSAIASVQNQSYDNWQLCICDDASTASWLPQYLKSLAESDPRIQFVVLPRRLGITESMNAAGCLAKGDHVAFLPQDGVLHRHCLFYVADACQEGLQVIYVDEDHLDQSGRRKEPQFKPDWSPDLLTSCMYWGHFWVAQKKLLEDKADGPERWFRQSFHGAEDYDLALRLTDAPLKVGHVPRVLYHSRFSAKAEVEAHASLSEANRLALEDAARRRGWSGDVDPGPIPGTFSLRRKLSDSPLVSIIVCSRNLKLFEPFLRRLAEGVHYDAVELVLVEHQAGGSKRFPLERLRAAWKKPLIHVPYMGAFNFSIMNNRAAQVATGSSLVFLNDDVEPLQADWLERLLGQIQRPEIGVAGACLHYPSGAIQHAGIALGMSLDGAGHPGRFLFHSNLFPWLKVTRNVTAVTGACLAIRKSVYNELGGMDPQFPVDYNDVDLCLRAWERSYLVVYEASAVLRHCESASRAGESRFGGRHVFLKRWAHLLQYPDPYLPSVIERKTEAIRLAPGQSIDIPTKVADGLGGGR